MNQLGRRKWAGFGRGIWTGSEIYVPFSFDAETSFGINNSSNGPFVSAVFHSVDSGASWNLEKISSSDSTAPTMCKTTQNLYYFAGIYPLWASGKSTHGGIWEEPIIISETPGRVHSRFAVCADGDTAHICWMDRRHNKSRLIVDGSPVENDEIYYSRRKDSEGRWESAVRLSGGLLYSYAPSISAEGNKVVVAWAGIDTADGRHTYMSPNDIYFVTSKDAGATWTEPVKVTDDTKGGITAGMPQVFLLNGTIHLLFTQGKRSGTKEISPGSSKLGNEPWPIYYTQRPFPE
jgi:hypothetical protein